MKTALLVAYLLYHEARGEGELGVNHVASVVYNNAIQNDAETVSGMYETEIFKTNRYTCLNGMTPAMISVPRGMTPADKKMWIYCMSIAQTMVNGSFVPASKATNYYNPSKCKPYWAKLLKDKFKYGNHVFGFLVS